MKKILTLAIITLLTVNLFAQKDKFVGIYEGSIEGAKGYPFENYPDMVVEVSRFANKEYKVEILSDKFSRADVCWKAEGLKEEDGKINTNKITYGGMREVDMAITPKGIEGKCIIYGRPCTLSFKPSKYVSPTMGLKAPKGAVVLFDGKDTSKWIGSNGNPCVWEIADNAMTVNVNLKDEKGKKIGTAIKTKDSFEAIKLHLEFKIPAEYEKNAQGRGNSGVYFGPYEIQILDTFGMQGTWNELGSIYRIQAPRVNAALEPEAWQTYDIEFHPAKYEGNKVVELPRMTAYLNGILIQDDFKIPYGTNLTKKNLHKFKHPTKINLLLQDHSNPVAYRNIWLEEIKD